MAKGINAINQKAFTKGFSGVQSGIGNTGKLMTQIQRVGMQQFFQSPERQNQLNLLRQMSGGQYFGLSPEEQGRIQERGRLAQEAAYRQSTDQIGNMGAAGGLTTGQQQQLLQNALFARSSGLADFQRQEYLRQLEEARQLPLYRLQATESLANALTGIPNFSQINEHLRTRIMAQQAALGGQAATARPSSSGGVGFNWQGLLGQGLGALAGRQ